MLLYWRKVEYKIKNSQVLTSAQASADNQIPDNKSGISYFCYRTYDGVPSMIGAQQEHGEILRIKMHALANKLTYSVCTV